MSILVIRLSKRMHSPFPWQNISQVFVKILQDAAVLMHSHGSKVGRPVEKLDKKS